MILYLDTSALVKLFVPEEIVQIEELLVRWAGEFCARYRLRGYDGVHLAAAERVHGASRDHADFRFGVFDANLVRRREA